MEIAKFNTRENNPIYGTLHDKICIIISTTDLTSYLIAYKLANLNGIENIMLRSKTSNFCYSLTSARSKK